MGIMWVIQSKALVAFTQRKTVVPLAVAHLTSPSSIHASPNGLTWKRPHAAQLLYLFELTLSRGMGKIGLPFVHGMHHAFVRIRGKTYGPIPWRASDYRPKEEALV